MTRPPSDPALRVLARVTLRELLVLVPLLIGAILLGNAAFVHVLAGAVGIVTCFLLFATALRLVRR